MGQHEIPQSHSSGICTAGGHRYQVYQLDTWLSPIQILQHNIENPVKPMIYILWTNWPQVCPLPVSPPSLVEQYNCMMSASGGMFNGNFPFPPNHMASIFSWETSKSFQVSHEIRKFPGIRNFLEIQEFSIRCPKIKNYKKLEKQLKKHN